MSNLPKYYFQDIHPDVMEEIMHGMQEALPEPSLEDLDRWLDSNIFADKLFFRTSSDDKLKMWSDPLEVDPTLDPAIDPLLELGSTTDKVYSRAYASVVPTQNGVRAVWQRRKGGISAISQVLTRSLTDSSVPTVLGNAAFEKFLPGSGCEAITGAYQVIAPGKTNPLAPFTYSVWPSVQLGGPIFTTGTQFDGTHGGDQRPKFPFPRIGEYTSVDCTRTTGWAA